MPTYEDKEWPSFFVEGACVHVAEGEIINGSKNRVPGGQSYGYGSYLVQVLGGATGVLGHVSRDESGIKSFCITYEDEKLETVFHDGSCVAYFRPSIDHPWWKQFSSAERRSKLSTPKDILSRPKDLLTLIGPRINQLRASGMYDRYVTKQITDDLVRLFDDANWLFAQHLVEQLVASHPPTGLEQYSSEGSNNTLRKWEKNNMSEEEKTKLYEVLEILDDPMDMEKACCNAYSMIYALLRPTENLEGGDHE